MLLALTSTQQVKQLCEAMGKLENRATQKQHPHSTANLWTWKEFLQVGPEVSFIDKSKK